VRVPDVILKCVGFVGEVASRDSSGTVHGDLCATGFFVSLPFVGNPTQSFAYFVTAKHVATELAGRDIYFLVNKKGGGVTIAPHHGDRWFLHPTDATADVAVIPVYNNPDSNITAVHVGNLGVPSLLQQLEIGIGDEVFATGLFTPAPGSKRNEPIVRHGNIAMMPLEQIQTELGFADVYLIEARSIGGLSGCPVFVRPTINMSITDQRPGIKNFFGLGHGATLLGLMHGHWDIKETEMNKVFISHVGAHGVNLGIGIVVPAYKILEVINRPELKLMRQEVTERLTRRNVPGMDSAKPKKQEPQFTEEDFEAALKKVSRKKD
jgi:hypothetical protein